MKISVHISVGTLKHFGAALPFIIGRNMFVSFMGLLVLAILIAGLVFFFYVIPLQSIEVSTQVSQQAFRESDLKSIIEELDRREAAFQAANIKQYRNIFILAPEIEDDNGLTR